MAIRDDDERVARRRAGGAGWGITAIAGVIILGLLALLLLPLFTNDRDVGSGTERIHAGISVDDIAANPGAYLGQTVTVGGPIGELVGTRAFTLNDNDVLGNDQVLVVGAKPFSAIPGRQADASLLADDTVQVTGTVRTFDLAAVEQEVGADLQDDRFRDWGGKPAIVAQSIRVVERAATTGQAAATVDAITDNPSAWIGKTVMVDGSVGDVLGQRAFTINDNDLIGDDEMLVVGAKPLRTLPGRQTQDVPLVADDIILVRGPVRLFDLAAAEKEVGADLDDNLFRDWAGKPAIIARSVRVLQPANDVTPGLPPIGLPPIAQNATAIDDIVGNPPAYIGKTVTVTGDVDHVLGPRSMIIGNDQVLTDEQVLVVGARPLADLVGQQLTTPLAADMAVQVRGPVRAFDLAAVEKEIGADLQDDLFRDWAGKPAVIAQTVNVLPSAIATGPAEDRPITEPTVIVNAANKLALVGRRVQFTSVLVQSVPGDRVFWVGPSADQHLLVVLDENRTPAQPTEGKVDVNTGQRVTLTGTIRHLPPPEQARQQWNLSEANAAQLQNQQVYLAAERLQVTQR